MSGYKYTLEAYADELVFDNTRRRSVESCPFCGKGNKDGKFVPYIGFKDRGHCFSCGQFSPVGVHPCPSCKVENSFNRYIEIGTDEYLDEFVGKCFYCDYHYPPKQYFEDKKSISTPRLSTSVAIPKQIKPSVIHPNPVLDNPSCIPVDIFKASLQNHNENNFVTFLHNLFGNEITNNLIGRYFIGTSKYWPGANVFWQIDSMGKIRTGKIMLYDPLKGKRIKIPISHVAWVHSVMKYPAYKLRQCFFGEHLLCDKSKPVAVVESEKTAIIASVYLPEFIWLAVGGKEGLSREKCNLLAGRSVTLFPDLNAFDLWTKKAKELSNITKFSVSDLLERKANQTEKLQGLDLADYLIKFENKQFQFEKSNLDQGPLKINKSTHESCLSTVPITPLVNAKPSKCLTLPNEASFPFSLQAHNFDFKSEVTSLESFFASILLPQIPIQLDKGVRIIDVPKFISGHLSFLRSNNGNPTFLPYLNRLRRLRDVLSGA